MSNDLALPATANEPRPTIESPILMDELMTLSFEEARRLVETNQSCVVIASRNLRHTFGGKSGTIKYFDMLRATDPNGESPETSEKALSSPPIYSHAPRATKRTTTHLQNKT